jgi:transcriptional regulator with XRE-family HTH domain
MKERNEYNIGLPLKVALIEKGLKVNEFSKMVVMNRVLIQHYLSNTQHPSYKTIEKFADVLDLDVDYFLDENFGKS